MNRLVCYLGSIRKKAVWGRTKATWGRAVLLGILVSALAGPSLSAESQNRGPNRGSNNSSKAKQHHSKLDQALNAVVDGNGESDVIVEFFDDRDSASRIRNNGGTAGRKLSILKARAARVPNALLRKLADDSKVKRVHLDREARGEMARTSATVGALSARLNYGYSGAGVGVAVIDSGIADWHDDFGAGVFSKTDQRVTAFVDFVNNQTSKYDDWGHGTHVAGIIAGSGYHSYGARAGIAPKANLIALKALDGEGRGQISNIIAALDWVVANRAQYNIRVVNMSLGAGVYESYHTDPLTLAAKRAVDEGIVVVAAAGNMGKAADGQAQYGAISAPANAPWVLTVGASSTQGTVDRRDDVVALYSSRGPTLVDFAAKPDLVAPGTGTVSLATENSLFYVTKPASLLPSLRLTNLLSGSAVAMPYLTLSGTSMATPVVAGTVALMMEANPNLTPNMAKAILQFTAEAKPGYDYLTQGAGFLNTLGAVRLSRYFATAQKGDHYPDTSTWSKHILWGNRRVSGGVLTPGGTAWALNVVWGDALTPSGQNIVWGDNCDTLACDNIIWGNNVVWGNTFDLLDNIVWSNTDGDDIVWGNCDFGNIVWGNGDLDNITWGNAVNVVWGDSELDNITWGNTVNVVWGNDIVWGNSAEEDAPLFGDDMTEVESFNPELFDSLFAVAPLTATTSQTGGQQ